MKRSALRNALDIVPLIGVLLGTSMSFALAAVVRVNGNQTSDVLATGHLIGGGIGGERFTEHPGTTGVQPATPGGVALGQTLGAQAAGASAALILDGHARLGDLGVSGDAVVSIIEPDGVSAVASGGIHAEWSTGFELLSDVLPQGSLVSLKFTWVVDGVLDLLADEGNSNSLLGQLGFSGGFDGLSQGQGRHLCDDFEGTCQHTQTFDLTARIGQSYGIRGQLELHVGAATDRNNSVFSNLASVRAGNSSHLYLDLLTPQVRYQLDDSGLQFERAPVIGVPEPGGLVLAGLALSGLVLVRRRSQPGAHSARLDARVTDGDYSQEAAAARTGISVTSARRLQATTVLP